LYVNDQNIIDKPLIRDENGAIKSLMFQKNCPLTYCLSDTVNSRAAISSRGANTCQHLPARSYINPVLRRGTQPFFFPFAAPVEHACQQLWKSHWKSGFFSRRCLISLLCRSL
jgi:hypothetical protein